MKKICILTMRDISSAYACLLYLRTALSKNSKVDIWSFSHQKQIKNAEIFHNSFTDTWYGKIRRFRVYAAKLHAFIISFKYDVLVINDLDFFRVGYYIKKIRPYTIVIQYNTEIHGNDIKYPRHTISFYEKHVDYPDMIIECLNERGDYRKKTFGIKKHIFVINNTLPLYEVNNALNSGINVSHFFKFKNPNNLTLIYAGGCNLSRSLGDIIECAEIFLNKINFLFFCYGANKDYDAVQNEVDKYENCYLYKAVDRITLLNVMNFCDIGIQYYDPDFSINHYLAAPSKFFEYISVGLNVISSNNYGINQIIDKYDLGVCFTNEEGIAGGINKLLNKGLNSRKKIKKIFETQLCYEVDAQKALCAINKMIYKE